MLVFRDCTTTESEDVQPKYFHLLAVPRLSMLGLWLSIWKHLQMASVVRNKKTSTIQGSFIYMTPTMKGKSLKFTIHLHYLIQTGNLMIPAIVIHPNPPKRYRVSSLSFIFKFFSEHPWAQQFSVPGKPMGKPLNPQEKQNTQNIYRFLNTTHWQKKHILTSKLLFWWTIFPKIILGWRKKPTKTT